jgi:hypothetical protein
MAATSNHWGDINIWIKKVISSMNDKKQYDAVQNLIFLLSERMKKQGVELGLVHTVQRTLLHDLFMKHDELWDASINQKLNKND